MFMFLIVPEGCTKPCLWLRRKDEGPNGPSRARRALRGPKFPSGLEGGAGPQIPAVIDTIFQHQESGGAVLKHGLSRRRSVEAPASDVHDESGRPDLPSSLGHGNC